MKLLLNIWIKSILILMTILCLSYIGFPIIDSVRNIFISSSIGGYFFTTYLLFTCMWLILSHHNILPRVALIYWNLIICIFYLLLIYPVGSGVFTDEIVRDLLNTLNSEKSGITYLSTLLLLVSLLPGVYSFIFEKIIAGIYRLIGRK